MDWRRWKTGLKMGLAVLVILFVGRHVAQTWVRLHDEGRTVRVAVGPLIGSVAVYLAGLSAFGVFYDWILAASPSPVGLGPAVRAYLISHLGKYVPGKALVVVLRVAQVAPYGARPATAAFATLYETLVMMACGGFVAAAGMLPALMNGRPPRPPDLVAAAAGLVLGVVFLTMTAPRVFPRISAALSVPFPGVGPEALPRFSWTLVAQGVALAFVGWILLGLSQVLVLHALMRSGPSPGDWPRVTAGVALGTVSGFAVAILPGGLGVREWVIWTTLEPVVGPERATVAALVLRLSWVAGEVLAAVVLSIVRPTPPSPPAVP